MGLLMQKSFLFTLAWWAGGKVKISGPVGASLLVQGVNGELSKPCSANDLGKHWGQAETQDESASCLYWWQPQKP